MSTTIVAGGVIEQEGKYLLIREAREDIHGKWNLLVGKQDLGETISELLKENKKALLLMSSAMEAQTVIR